MERCAGDGLGGVGEVGGWVGRGARCKGGSAAGRIGRRRSTEVKEGWHVGERESKKKNSRWHSRN